MHFKHPEILYALFALLIPILIHLFQLQRFVKVPFTNVKFLKQIELQTRKSSRLKKLLILTSRLLALAFLIFAFAQPFSSKNDVSKKQETILYLDNSFSMQSLGNNGELLKRATQDIIENLPENSSYVLLNNDQIWTNLDKISLKEVLLQMGYTAQKQDINNLIIKVKQHTSRFPDTQFHVIWISDFQKNGGLNAFSGLADLNVNLIRLQPTANYNLSIDSVYVAENNSDYKIIQIKLKNQGKKAENVTLSAFQNTMLLAKSNITAEPDQTLETSMRLTGDLQTVKLSLNYDDTFPFDNQYMISFTKQEKIPILAATENNTFLDRIFTKDEFIFTKLNIRQISNDVIDKNQLIILNQPEEISAGIITKLTEFVKSGGSLAIIPHAENHPENLNQLFNQLNIGQLTQKTNDSLLITKIHYGNPLLQNVFEKQISNFQYPIVTVWFSGKFLNAQPVLSFENQSDFIVQFNVGQGKMYWISAPLDLKYSNFTNSPLVVPVFYNMAKMSTLQNQLAYNLGENNQIKIPTILQKDQVVRLTNGPENLIPMQEIHTDFVMISTDNALHKPGFYEVKNKEQLLQTLAFNSPKTESLLHYGNLTEISDNQININIFNNIKEAFSTLEDTLHTQSFFQWFLAFALLFFIIEIALINYL